ncbi:MAG: amidohydrolase family protein [Acidobacteria bacterium]|nr:amidohydrolase family protein [Acidobacteriota bacterium]
MKPRLFLLALGAIGSIFSLSAFAQSYAITNARIVTVSGGTIERGTVVVRDGLIESVGADVRTPADAHVFDGTGLTVYPGFIDSLTNLGIAAPRPSPSPAGAGGFGQAAAAAAAANPSNSNYPNGFRPEDMTLDDVRAGDSQFEANRNAGFTTALTVGRTGIFNGHSALIELAGNSVSAMTVKNPVALHVTFATIPGQYPGSLLGTFSALRQMLNDARRQQELEKMYAANPRGMKRPESDKSLDALIPVLNRQMAVVFTANRANDIVRALDLAKEYNLKAIISGGQEADKFIDRLKAQDVAVLLSLNFPKRTAAASPEADDEPMETLRFRANVPKVAGKLAAAGIKFAFEGGGATNANDFLSNAAKTTENGLSKDAAIRAMTLGPAEIFGVADRLGSVEAGKIANLTVVRGDVFGNQKVITHVFVDGAVFQPKPPAPAGPGGRGPRGGAPGAGNRGDADTSPGSVVGTYAIAIDIPGQPLSGTLTITQQGSSLAGTLSTELGSGALTEGQLSGSSVSFAGSVSVGGQTVPFTVKATVTGTRLSGTIDSTQGSFPISGTKNP